MVYHQNYHNCSTLVIVTIFEMFLKETVFVLIFVIIWNCHGIDVSDDVVMSHKFEKSKKKSKKILLHNLYFLIGSCSLCENANMRTVQVT
jgi:hypothetical protein